MGTFDKVCGNDGLTWINLHRLRNGVWRAELWSQEEAEPTHMGTGTTVTKALEDLEKHAIQDVIEDYEWDDESDSLRVVDHV